MNIFFSAGEASGDTYAAALLNEIVRLSGDDAKRLKFSCIGGKRMLASGATVVADSSGWGAISILESLKVVPRVLGSYLRVKAHLKKSTPGLLVPIDFGFLNVRLSRYAKRLGWRVLYFIPPGSWRRDKQGKDLPAITDEIVTPFSWSADLLRKGGARAQWFGHPIKQLLRDRGVGRSPLTSSRIAVLPGSRRHEIEQHLPIVAGAIAGPIEFALAPAVDVEAFRKQWEKLAPGRNDDQFTSGDVYGVLSRCQSAVVCSGTATLEAALCRCPMVVIYRFPKIAEIEAKLVGFKRPEFISLPNILLQKRAVPELVQEEATVDNLKKAMHALGEGPFEREKQLASFDELDVILGSANAITQTARLALEVLKAIR